MVVLACGIVFLAVQIDSLLLVLRCNLNLHHLIGYLLEALVRGIAPFVVLIFKFFRD